jgi:exopolyphosphatase/guanosine-5'-triphosphate,3'-diphosphate pyrophosphatase
MAARCWRVAKPNSSMPAETRAVIDVGTNSVKLLVADVAGKVVTPLHEGSHQTRLGHGFYETHVLQAGAIDQTAKAVADFVNEAHPWNPTSFKIIATSAARDAVNKDELLRAIESVAGIPVTIISGEQEADWVYKGVTSDPLLANSNLLVMDVGGGSSEFILGAGAERIFAESFPIGSVRLLEKISIGDPPLLTELAECERSVHAILIDEVVPKLRPNMEAMGNDVQLVGTGGTSTILARIQLKLRSFSREMIEGTFLSREMLKTEMMRLWSVPLETRKQIIGLPANRADVILPGVVIFHQVMEIFGLATLRVSTRGLRFAALMD